MSNSLEREIEWYREYTDRYDPGKPSPIKDYSHPPSPRTEEYARLSEDTRIEIQELILQGVANWPWPEWNILNLISDRANVAENDVLEAFKELVYDKTLRCSDSDGFELNIDQSVALTSSES